jgi:hypothetical protein
MAERMEIAKNEMRISLSMVLQTLLVLGEIQERTRQTIPPLRLIASLAMMRPRTKQTEPSKTRRNMTLPRTKQTEPSKTRRNMTLSTAIL